MSGLLSKQRLLELLGRLNEKLAAAEERGEIYIVGGAMMVLAHGAERRTRDIDCHMREGAPTIRQAVAEIANEKGLSPEWLNEAVTMRHLPVTSDPGERTVYKASHLLVQGASLERMIAMKLHAGRPDDIDDLNLLLDEAKVEKPEQARRLHYREYAGRAMPATSDRFLFEKLIRSKLPAREQAVSGDDPEVAPPPTPTGQGQQPNREYNGGRSR